MFDFFKKKDNQNEQASEKQEEKKSFWHFSFEGLKKTISNTTPSQATSLPCRADLMHAKKNKYYKKVKQDLHI